MRIYLYILFLVFLITYSLWYNQTTIIVDMVVYTISYVLMYLIITKVLDIEVVADWWEVIETTKERYERLLIERQFELVSLWHYDITFEDMESFSIMKFQLHWWYSYSCRVYDINQHFILTNQKIRSNMKDYIYNDYISFIYKNKLYYREFLYWLSDDYKKKWYHSIYIKLDEDTKVLEEANKAKRLADEDLKYQKLIDELEWKEPIKQIKIDKAFQETIDLYAQMKHHVEWIDSIRKELKDSSHNISNYINK